MIKDKELNCLDNIVHDILVLLENEKMGYMDAEGNNKRYNDNIDYFCSLIRERYSNGTNI